MSDKSRFDALCKDERIKFISDERETPSFRKTENGTGVWLFLKRGWIDPETDCHSVTEHTLADLSAGMKRITRCDCSDCTETT